MLGRLQRGFRESMQAKCGGVGPYRGCALRRQLGQLTTRCNKAGVAAGKLQCVGTLTTDVSSGAGQVGVAGAGAERDRPCGAAPVAWARLRRRASAIRNRKRECRRYRASRHGTSHLRGRDDASRLVDESLLESPWFVEAEQRWRSASVKLMPTPDTWNACRCPRSRVLRNHMQPDRRPMRRSGWCCLSSLGREGDAPEARRCRTDSSLAAAH